MSFCSVSPPAADPDGGEASGAERMKLLHDCKHIAVVGLSGKPDRPSHFVTVYLLEKGYVITGVAPSDPGIPGVPCVTSLQDVSKPLEIVNIFRNPAAVPAIVDEAIAAGAKAVWMQPGAVHRDAAKKAHAAGLLVITDCCIMVEHAKSHA